MIRSVSRTRRGFNLAEVVVVLVVLLILIGLLFPAFQKANYYGAAAGSLNNLKWIGIATHNFAAANNYQLPSATLKNAPLFFSGPKGMEGKPQFAGGVLAYMDGSVKSLQALLDVNINDQNRSVACSYSIPLSWSTLEEGTGNLTFPGSFPRGTANCVAVAEMTTFGRTYASIQPFDDTPYTPAVANSPSSTANSFFPGGCQVVMMDASVKRIEQAENTANNWTAACHPEDRSTLPNLDW